MDKEALTGLGLNEEQTESVLALHNEALGGLAPKTELEASNAENKQLKAAVSERDKQLAELQKSAGLTNELKQRLEEAIAQNKAEAENMRAALEESKKDSAVNIQLIKNGAKNLKAARALIDMDKITVDGESVAGLLEQLEAIKASDSYMFEPPLTGREPYGGEKHSADGYKNNPFKKETFNLTEQGRVTRENPELAERLKAAARQ